MQEIFNYLATFSQAAASAQIESILNKLELLKNFPKIGQVIPDFANEKLRELIIGNYRVAYYIVSDIQIDILTVHHSAFKK